MTTTTIEITTLKQHIDYAAGQLEKKPTLDNPGDGMGSLIYLGNHHDAIPRDLVLDPVLESGEIHTWMLMKVHVDNPMLATRIPSQDTLMEQLKCSRPIVSRHMQVLRALRWLTLCAEVRGADGQFRGAVYAQHDQPLSLADTLYLDPGYIDFLEQPTRGDVLRRLQHIKQGVLSHTDYLVFRGLSLEASPSHLEHLDGRFKSYFSNDPLDTHLSCPPEAVNPGGVTNLYGSTEGSSVTADIHHVNNIDMGETPKSDHVKNIDPVFSPENSHVKNIDMVETAKIGEKTTNHHVKNIDMGDNRNSSSGSSLLNNSFLNKKTTTTPPTPPSNLSFPKCLSKSPRQTAYAQKKIAALPENQQQFALDYLSDRVRAGEGGTEKPVGNPIQYLEWIVRSLLDGTLPETGYGLRSTPSSSGTQTSKANPSAESPEETQRRWKENMERLGKVLKSDGSVEKSHVG